MMRLLKSLLALSLLFASASPAQVDPVARGIAIQALNKANSISGSSGTVTSVSVTTANGVSGTVATPTTTPAISVTLGAITPSSVAATGNVTGSNLSGTNTGDQATGTSGHVLGFLDGNNTFSGTNTFNAAVAVGNSSNLTVTSTSSSTVYASRFQTGGTNSSFPGLADGYLGLTAIATDGATLGGYGSTYDVSLYNKSGVRAFSILAGTTNAQVVGSLAVGGVTAFNTSGILQAASFPALTGDVTTSAGALGTTIAAGAVSVSKMANLAASSLLGNPTGSPAAPSAITLAGGLAFSGTTLTAAGALTPTSVVSSGGVSGTTIAGTSSILSSGATAGIGYATGAGGTATQGTSRVTGVTINKACGAITIFSAAGAATYNTFTVTDSAVAATDVIDINQKSGTNLYIILITSVGAGTFNVSFATTGGTATDAPVFNYCDIKGVAA